MSYIGIRSTGSIYGTREERKAFSDRARRRAEIVEIRDGIRQHLGAELLDAEMDYQRDDKVNKRRPQRQRGRLVGDDLHALFCFRYGRSHFRSCAHPICRSHTAEDDAERGDAEIRRRHRAASGELAHLLGSRNEGLRAR